MAGDFEKSIKEHVIAAAEYSQALSIYGGNSKSFYGRKIVGEPLCIAEHSGIVEYNPEELVLTARAGTTISEINLELARNNQILGFEPPALSRKATLGGTVAAGFAGPARPFRGSVQDFVLGTKVLNGKGQAMRFGGKVIKNVAGFDVSRLMVGTLGCLGILLEVSLKVLPKPEAETTVLLEHENPADAIEYMNKLAGKPLPITAATWFDGITRIRLSGSEAGIKAAARKTGGRYDPEGMEFWRSLRELEHPYFEDTKLLLRGSVAPATEVFCADERQLIDWGGATRWLCVKSVNREFGKAVQKARGHVTIFWNGNRDQEVFTSLPPATMRFHKILKGKFDPKGILNQGRMYDYI